MRITLNNTDIESALIDYVQTMGINTFNCDFDIQTIKGRKTGDLVAEIDIIQRKSNPTIGGDALVPSDATPKDVGARDEVETTQPLFNRPDTLVMDDVVSDEDDVEEGRSTGLNFLS